MTYNFAERAKVIFYRLFQRYSSGTTVATLTRKALVKDKVAQSVTETPTSANLNGILARYDEEESSGLGLEEDLKFITDYQEEISKEDGDVIVIGSNEYRVVNVHRIEWNGTLVAQEIRIRR